MRVQVKTTLGGLVFRTGLTFVLGGAAALIAQDKGWFDSYTLPTPTVTAPATPTVPTPTPRPTTPKASDPAEPPVWTNIGGIVIPPPGWNDTHH